MEDVNINRLRNVVFVQSARARRLRVSIRPFKPVRVTFPPTISLKKAQEFLQSNMQWVQKTVLKMKQVEQNIAHAAALPPIEDVKAASQQLHLKLKELAMRHNFAFNRVFIKNQKTRWGSCSSKNNINLNINLVRLEPALQEYVILHELVHTRIKNHSARFWNELDKYVPNSKAVARKLRKHSLSVLHFAA